MSWILWVLGYRYFLEVRGDLVDLVLPEDREVPDHQCPPYPLYWQLYREFLDVLVVHHAPVPHRFLLVLATLVVPGNPGCRHFLYLLYVRGVLAALVPPEDQDVLWLLVILEILQDQ
jgi:hypothetical protein